MKRVFAVLMVLCLMGSQLHVAKAAGNDYYPTSWRFDEVEWIVSDDGLSASATARFYGYAGGRKVYNWQPMQIISVEKDRFGRNVFTAYLSAGRALDGQEHTAQKTVFPKPVVNWDVIGPDVPIYREVGRLVPKP